MTYNAADNSAKSYALAIDTMREKLESFHRVQIGDCTLYQGDCREILPLLPKVDAVVTDPPYGIDGTWSGGNSHGWGKFGGEAAAWDTRPDWFEYWISDGDRDAIVWGGQYFNLPPSGSWLVWDKMVREFTSGHCELAWTNIGKPIRAFSACNAQLATEGKVHPTQKPLELMKWCIRFFPDARTILDPFMGSGTTGVACVKLGRNFIGIEIEPKYFEIACKRIQSAYDQPDMFIEQSKAEQPKQEALL